MAVVELIDIGGFNAFIIRCIRSFGFDEPAWIPGVMVDPLAVSCIIGQSLKEVGPFRQGIGSPPDNQEGGFVYDGIWLGAWRIRFTEQSGFGFAVIVLQIIENLIESCTVSVCVQTGD